jgi:hypothetical protein
MHYRRASEKNPDNASLKKVAETWDAIANQGYTPHPDSKVEIAVLKTAIHLETVNANDLLSRAGNNNLIKEVAKGKQERAERYTKELQKLLELN